MSDSWPGNVCLHMPSRMSQSYLERRREEKGFGLNFITISKQNFSYTFAEASQAPETKVRVSGESDSDMTSPVCPVKEVHCWPVSMSHRAL